MEIVSSDEAGVVARVEREGEPTRELRFQHVAGPISGAHLIMEDGRSVPTRMAPGAHGAVTAVIGAARVEVRVVSERDAWLGAGVEEADDGRVTVSMPGLVVKVLAPLGTAVEAGQPLLIIEAMKMENEVKAGRAGVVTAVHVGAGDSVEADAVLMEIGDAE
ncbi:MAG: biotin/lipoyl-containing protein [Myxococcota bacterium]